MSADKRKRHTRAMAYLRAINRSPWMQGQSVMSGRELKSPIVRYCLDRGFATVRRIYKDGWPPGLSGIRNRRTLLETGLDDNVTRESPGEQSC